MLWDSRASGQATYVFEMRDGKKREAALPVASPPGGGRDAGLEAARKVLSGK